MATLTNRRSEESTDEIGREFCATDKRLAVFRSVFGRKNKSAFVWAVDRSDEDDSLFQKIQKLHKGFWSGKPVALDRDWQGEFDAVDWAIFRVAIAAYFGLGWEVEYEVQYSANDRLLRQLTKVEEPLWFNLREDGTLNDGQKLVSRFESSVGDALDGDGLPLAALVPDLVKFVASWCRSFKLLDFAGYEIDPEVTGQLNWLSYQLARLTRSDKTTMLGNKNSAFDCKSFRNAIVEIWSDREEIPFGLKSARCLKICGCRRPVAFPSGLKPE